MYIFDIYAILLYTWIREVDFLFKPAHKMPVLYIENIISMLKK